MLTVKEPGALLMFDGRLVMAVAIGTGKMLHLKALDKAPCPTCGHTESVHVLEHSPFFQEKAGPVVTVEVA